MKNVKGIIVMLLTVAVTAMTATTAFAAETGALLPDTGGIGTTIFYIVGALLVVGAVVVMISRKRMSNDEDD
ncbi:MAG: LPXTG cell wall anchor domain-containing protein [Ruminococcaceae bacterium]|nr:LPXTG cell wall anchor domain-containing protein [Oscillospiraceae bacterium]